ncbi:MAG: C4-dicarboxylate ABC transporter [Burkholderiaceae bacterium]|nr:C4-dicarboxylate ABC transporter [Burkholderiaceae bacterium]
MSAQQSGLATVGPQWFAPVMGWSGLALAWHRAGPVFGERAHDVGLVAAALAALVFIAVLAASVLRALRHPKALAQDVAHPVRHAFVAALPVSLLLLGTIGYAFRVAPQAASMVWALGLVLEGIVTVWVISRIIGHGIKWPAMTPILFIPVVGNVLVPLAGSGMGHTELSWAFLGIGVFFWPLLLALILARTATQPIPPRLVPSWFITIAPPAVVGIAAMNLGAGRGFGMAMLGVGLIFLATSLARMRQIRELPFGMPHWAASFPLAALSALALRLAADSPALRLPATALLALASVVIVFLSFSTLKGLRNGSLLEPEPVAPIVPIEATAKP